MVTTRVARPGDRVEVEALAGVALGVDTAPGNKGQLGTAVDERGGLLPVPHGSAYALVAAAADDAPICGLAYSCPPVHPAFGQF
ncbi:hypothetical protein IMZ11_35170 [Microtetraspora sp. AC03309]|uniref:hypothetical protein n=1 Tax=Microtetraspora sp. AC03309 TaxID=2779376 RepID=UPI001E6408A7|nr:hypothetical protein [Microtetraspora sp. AC03309]MCC5580868.1 hypothetical protein [Microtetraspora sp. AC03309]